ncbi:MAG: iron-sulfur cluster assembly protein [Alphaproteobacteria bacterium]
MTEPEKGLKNQVPTPPRVSDTLSEEEAALIEPPHVEVDKTHPLWPAVRDAMREIYDPEIPVNIYELGLIYAIKFLENDGVIDLDIKMTLTSPGCPVAQEMPGWVQGALFPLQAVGEVDVEIIWDPPWDPSKMSETAKMQLNMFY